MPDRRDPRPHVVVSLITTDRGAVRRCPVCRRPATATAPTCHRRACVQSHARRLATGDAGRPDGAA